MLRTPPCKGVLPLAHNARNRYFANQRTPQDPFFSTLLERPGRSSGPTGGGRMTWRRTAGPSGSPLQHLPPGIPSSQWIGSLEMSGRNHFRSFQVMTLVSVGQDCERKCKADSVLSRDTRVHLGGRSLRVREIDPPTPPRAGRRAVERRRRAKGRSGHGPTGPTQGVNTRN